MGDRPRSWRLDQRVDREALLGAAVASNASWCDAVCRSHGFPGTSGPRVWISAGHDLEFFPNAITLRPDATAAETQAGRDLSRRYAVKDSFARLDLAPAGLDLLFEAEWIAAAAVPAGPGDPGLSWDAVTDGGGLARWETAWAQGSSSGRRLFRPQLLADPRCAILACHRDGDLVAGVIAYTAAGVTGISSLFGPRLPAGQLRASALRAVAALRPGLPAVGYEHGPDLADARQAGCRSLGPLRVWERQPL
jgi:hypothetical protein